MNEPERATTKKYLACVWIDEEPAILLKTWAQSPDEALAAITARYGERRVVLWRALEHPKTWRYYGHVRVGDGPWARVEVRARGRDEAEAALKAQYGSDSEVSLTGDDAPQMERSRAPSIAAWYRRRWNESRGDEFDAWGPATYYFHADQRGVVDEQIEVYDDGHVLSYDAAHVQDRYGGLAEQPLDLVDFARFEVDEATVRREARQGPGAACG